MTVSLLKCYSKFPTVPGQFGPMQLFLASTIYMVVIKQTAEEAKVCISLMLQKKNTVFCCIFNSDGDFFRSHFCYVNTPTCDSSYGSVHIGTNKS